MFHLQQYRTVPDCLSDFLVWGTLITPSVMLNKDGSFQRTFKFRGPDLESSTESELVIACAQLNNTLMRLGARWAIQVEAQRSPARDYPNSHFPDQVSFLVDAERRADFVYGTHLQSDYYMTLVYRPLSDKAKRAKNTFIEQGDSDMGDGGGSAEQQDKASSHKSAKTRDPFSRREDLEVFLKATGDLFRQLARTVVSIQILEGEECLSYLHSTISLKKQTVEMPDPPIFLDAYLADTPLIGGLAPKLGDQHLRILSFRYFPSHSQPALLDELNQLGIEYRWTSRFIGLDKSSAVKELDKLQKNWFKKQKSFLQVIMEALTKESSPFTNTDAVNKAQEADEALQAIQADMVAYGYYTGTVIVWDRDVARVDEKRDLIQSVVHSKGITTVEETVNAVDAFLGSLPGHCAANVRYPMISTLNLIHLLPYSAVWAGEAQNTHLSAPALMLTSAGGATPFWFNLHQEDVGHTLVLGPTGAGKSTLLWMIAIQFLRYPKAQVFAFDKGLSGLVTTSLVGGHHYLLGVDTPERTQSDTASDETPSDTHLVSLNKASGLLALQPLANIDQAEDFIWAYEWLVMLVRSEGISLDPAQKTSIRAALKILAGFEIRLRTLTGFVSVVQDTAIRRALAPFTLDGGTGGLLDADADTLSEGHWLCFEMEALMNKPHLVVPVLDYLFHKLEQRFDGSPTLVILDEAWLFLSVEYFARKIQEWLKVLRRANVSVVFASQELHDAANSIIFPSLMNNCLTKIYLPNSAAMNEQTQPLYFSFGLNDQQTRLIASATPKRQYYYTSPAGNRLLDLDLGEVALHTVGASRKDVDLPLITSLNAEYPEDTTQRAAAWYTARGVTWAGEMIEQHAFAHQPNGPHEINQVNQVNQANLESHRV